ncbi:MAG: hypothetical protein ACYSR8_11415 [Planctomycetota bacterium]
MGHSKDFILKSQYDNLYEFQAWDKFFRLVRGRIEADSKLRAREMVKSRGYYLPIIWLHGKEPLRVFGIHQYGGYIEQHSPELKLKREDGNSLIYTTRNLPRFIVSLIFILIGIGLIIYCSVQELGISENAFICGVGIVFLVVGILIIFRYLELKVDGQTRQIFIRMRIIPGKWQEQQINADVAEKVILHQETFYMSERATVYVVSLVTSGERIHLDASSSRETQTRLGQKVAEYLSVPFVCEN